MEAVVEMGWDCLDPEKGSHGDLAELSIEGLP